MRFRQSCHCEREALNEKLKELDEEELSQVTGGFFGLFVGI